MDLSTKKKLLRGPSKYICCVFRLQSVVTKRYQFLKICSRELLFSKLFFKIMIIYPTLKLFGSKNKIAVRMEKYNLR